MEILTGVPLTGSADPTPLYEGSAMRSLLHRTALSLQYLHEWDTNLNPSPVHDWDAYCAPDAAAGTSLEWSEIVVSGWSVGATQAAFVSFVEPTAGLLVVEGGLDFCEVDGAPPNVGNYNTSGDVPTYYATQTNASPVCDYSAPGGPDPNCVRRVAWSHVEELYPSAQYPALPAAYADFGYRGPSYLVDPASAPFVSQTGFTSTSPPSNALFSDQEPVSGCEPHGSMALDGCMPDAYSGGFEASPGVPVGASNDTSGLYLFPALLEAMCWVGE